MTAATGRTTIALSPKANSVVDELCQRFSFKERADAAKLGIAYAIRKGLDPEPRKRSSQAGPTGTTWGVGGFDSDGRLRELVTAVFPGSSEDPYATLENLMNRGLVRLAEVMDERRPQTLAELVALAD